MRLDNALNRKRMFLWSLLMFALILIGVSFVSKIRQNLTALWVKQIMFEEGEIDCLDINESQLCRQPAATVSYLCAYINHRCGNYQVASEIYSIAKSENERFYLASFMLGSLYATNKQFDAATREWLDSGAAEVVAKKYRRLLLEAFETGDYDEANRMLDIVTELQPEWALPYWNAAAAYRSKDNEKMLDAIGKGLSLDKSSPLSFVARGLLVEYRGNQEPELAFILYLQTLIIDSNERYAHVRLSSLKNRYSIDMR